MKYIFIILFFLFQKVGAQLTNQVSKINGNDIQWVSGLSWDEVKTKAKKENKYIFMDVFATWCGPCKIMDKETFSLPSVASALNQKFIAVKVQMDKTKDDNAHVKGWYKDAEKIGRDYWVRSYPTSIYLTSSGELVHIVRGFMAEKRFLNELAKAIEPGRKYVDPEVEYFKLQDEYNSGSKKYENMPSLFFMALKRGDKSIANTVSKEYMQYLQSVDEDVLYSKKNLEFLAEHPIASNSRFFKLFYPKGKKADKSMDSKGFAQSIVDRTIFKEITAPILGIKNRDFNPFGGKLDSSEADWDKLEHAITEKYGKSIAKRNVTDARIIWYAQKFNTPKIIEWTDKGIEEYGVEKYDLKSHRSFGTLNHKAWRIFESTMDKVTLQKAAKWMSLVEKYGSKHPGHPGWFDTYANILYKLGRVTDAIAIQQRVVNFAKENGYYALSEYQKTLDMMRDGKPTWPIPK